jgi:hypothetical protein
VLGRKVLVQQHGGGLVMSIARSNVEAEDDEALARGSASSDEVE